MKAIFLICQRRRSESQRKKRRTISSSWLCPSSSTVPSRSHYDRRMSGRIRFSSDLESSRARYSMRKVVWCMRHCYVHMHVHSICTRANDFIANTEWERERYRMSQKICPGVNPTKKCVSSQCVCYLLLNLTIFHMLQVD